MGTKYFKIINKVTKITIKLLVDNMNNIDTNQIEICPIKTKLINRYQLLKHYYWG